MQLGGTHYNLFEEICIDLDILLPFFWCRRFLKNSGHGTGRLTSATIDALIRIDHSCVTYMCENATSEFISSTQRPISPALNADFESSVTGLPTDLLLIKKLKVFPFASTVMTLCCPKPVRIEVAGPAANVCQCPS